MNSRYTFDSGLVVHVDDDERQVRSTFPDGTELVVGIATSTEEDIARARALGYTGDDIAWQMHRDHDLLHHVVAIAEGWPYSVVLHHVATGRPIPDGFGNREERLVFLLAKALNDGLSGLLP